MLSNEVSSAFNTTAIIIYSLIQFCAIFHSYFLYEISRSLNCIGKIQGAVHTKKCTATSVTDFLLVIVDFTYQPLASSFWLNKSTSTLYNNPYVQTLFVLTLVSFI